MANTEYKVKLTGDQSGLVRATNSAKGALTALSKELSGLQGLAAKALNFTGIGGAASIGGIVVLAKNIAETSKRLQTLAAVSNTSAEEFQRWAIASKTVGIEQDKMADILKDVQDKIGDFLETGGGPMADFFENIAPRVGVTAEQFRKLSGPQALQLYVDSLQKANLSQAQMTFYMEALASDSTLLLPLLKNNGQAMKELGDQAQAAGAILSNDLVQQGVELDKNLNTLQLTVQGLGISIGSDLIPALNKLAGEFLNARKSGLSFLEALVGIGLSNPGKSPAEQIATLQQDLERIQRGNLSEVSLLEKLAPEEALEQTRKQLAYFQLELQRDSASSQRAVAGLSDELATVQGNIDKLESLQSQRGGYLNSFDKAALARFKGEAADLQSRIDTLQGLINKFAAPSGKTESNTAQDRLKLEKQLAEEVARLEKLRAVESGKANASILIDAEKTSKARIELDRKAQQEELKGAERLRDALRTAWQQSIEGARSAREAAAALLQQAADARQSGTDRAQDRRMRGMTEDERDTYARRQSQEMRDQASRSATFAQNAALRGDLERAAQLSAEAAKYAERAEKYADQITDDNTAANLIEDLGRIREDALKAQAKVKEQEAANLEDIAQRQNQLITEQEARLEELRNKLDKPITLQADITAAEAAIGKIQAQLDQLKDKTITVTVQTQNAAGGLVDSAVDVPARAFGGRLPGRAFGDRSDNVLYRGTPGEWVIQRPAVRYWGEDFIRAINEMRLPAFADGGRIPGQSLVHNLRPAYLPPASTASQTSKTPIILQLPNGQQFPMTAADDVAQQVAQVFKRAALARGNRK